MSDNQPKAIKQSIKVEVKKGETYYWCSCGLSAKQPFCDGSHSGTEFAPVVYTAEEDALKGFCGCKATGNKPFCDGSHKNVV